MMLARSERASALVCLLMDFDRHEYHFGLCARVSLRSFLPFRSACRYSWRLSSLFTFFQLYVLCYISLNNRSLLGFHKFSNFMFLLHSKYDLSVYYPLHLLAIVSWSGSDGGKSFMGTLTCWVSINRIKFAIKFVGYKCLDPYNH